MLFNTVFLVSATQYQKNINTWAFNSLTPILVLVGIKNYPSVEFILRNSTFFHVFLKHDTIPNHHHHGEPFAPPTEWIRQMRPI